MGAREILLKKGLNKGFIEANIEEFEAAYEKGRKQGREEIRSERIKAALESGLSVREIAETFKFSEYYVRKVKKSIQLEQQGLL